jgi:hypothetical protein
MRRTAALLATVSLGAFLGSCGSAVSGHIYQNNGGVVQVEFRSEGKALVSAGTVVRRCSYSESGNSVSLVCNGETTKFKVQNDGALVGPADGLMARLTPVEN